MNYVVTRQCEGHNGIGRFVTLDEALDVAVLAANACRTESIDDGGRIFLPCHGSRVFVRDDNGALVHELVMLPGRGWCEWVGRKAGSTGDGWKRVTRARIRAAEKRTRWHSLMGETHPAAHPYDWTQLDRDPWCYHDEREALKAHDKEAP